VNCRLLAPATFAPVPLVDGFAVALGLGLGFEVGVGVGVVEGLVPALPRVAR